MIQTEVVKFGPGGTAEDITEMKTSLSFKIIILILIYILPVVVSGQGPLTNTTFFSLSLNLVICNR